MDDIFAVFTKKEASNSYHAAGHYGLRFPNGWTQSFCPRLNTIKSYPVIGPFKNEEDLLIELRRQRSKE